MAWTRRELLEWSAGLGALAVLPGCPTPPDDLWPPLPECDPPRASWTWEGAPGPEALFAHGVASGDPLADAVILWTRVSPEDGADVEVYWEIARTPDFAEVHASGVVTATAARDHTVKVDATCLTPATTWYYRFQAIGRSSPVGRTRTAAYGVTAALRFALCSCSNYAYGWFHAYRDIAQRDDLDFVAHVGDYIYEYGDGEYGDVRPLDPPHEVLTLDDYRRRYRWYRLDPDLQEVHRQHPFVASWDDHETADNSWSGGAGNHQSDEGDWSDRVAAARQAYFEWLPIREEVPGRIYRRLLYGDLLDLIVLDTRIEGRGAQADTVEDAYRPGSQLLGAAQEAWLLERLGQSPSTWKVLAQQVVMAQWALTFDDEGRGRPLNKDAWDGYADARRRVLQACADQDIGGLLVLTGDVHSSWANDLVVDFRDYDADTRAGVIGVEAVCPGISSPGAGGLQDTLIALNPHIRWGESGLRGWVLLDLTHDRVRADWRLLAAGSVESAKSATPQVAASFVSSRAAPKWEPSEPLAEGEGPAQAP